ncbi:MAG: TrbG/VirB9 family P-type conjugative transfer protein [Succinatimonas sp.]|nr:TrbG/VirB9 family P-type conjugative transfer protein [Succinatimonas sp.]MDD6755990.1 TrbG/VirB9 family P-type conjugative transfer protein [Succinatimonas sp.]
MKMSVLIKLERLSLLSVILSCLFFSSYSAFADNVDLDDRDLKTLSKLDLLDAKQVAGTAYKAGLVTFAYGSGIPTVVCALLELTDLAFEKGESILSVQLGDSVRWNIESAISGSANDSVEHLIVKPLEAGLKTSMLITTDRRTYHLRLKSTEADFMPAVVFSYPNSLKLPSKKHYGNDSYLQYSSNYDSNEDHNDYSETNSSLKYYSSVQNVSYEENSRPALNVAATYNDSTQRRNYNYSVDGDSKIIPQNVYDDGKRTFIVMNNPINSSYLPVLQEISSESFLFFGEDKTNTINFTYFDNTFVVDGIYSHLRLISKNGEEKQSADVVRLES